MLRAAGFVGDDASFLLKVCRFGSFSAGQTLSAPGDPGTWPEMVCFVLSGRVRVEPFALEVGEGGILGAADFCCSGALLSQPAASVVAWSEGTLAAVSFASLRSLLAGRSAVEVDDAEGAGLRVAPRSSGSLASSASTASAAARPHAKRCCGGGA